MLIELPIQMIFFSPTSLSEKTKFREKAEKLNEEILTQKEKTYATIGAKLEEAKTGKALLQERLENKKEMVRRNNARSQELEEKSFVSGEGNWNRFFGQKDFGTSFLNILTFLAILALIYLILGGKLLSKIWKAT